MTDPNASITTPMSTEEWTTNPFMWTTNSFTRNFNPSTTTGNKTFIEKTKSPADGSRIGDILTFTRLPDGTLNKHKARLCAHGGMQQWGDNYWETYSPVVNMLSVRLLLSLAKIYNLDSKAIDFVLAFPQADLDVDIWMYLPIGFQVDGQTEADSDRRYILKLNKNNFVHVYP